MRVRCRRLIGAWLSVLLLPAVAGTAALADDLAAPLITYETIEPAHITLGQSALLRVTSLEGTLRKFDVPTVPGLSFRVLGRTQGVETQSGRLVHATYILVSVTPQHAGVFSIPGVTPTSPTVGLDVLDNREPDPYVLRSPDQAPKPLPVAPVRLPDNLHLEAGGAAFVRLVVPPRTVHVGESVPIDIEMGLQPGLVLSLNAPFPALTSHDLTLNDLSTHPKRTEQVYAGRPFVIFTWHSALTAVKPGDFSVSAQMPITAKIDSHAADDLAFAARLGWPFLQNTYKSIPVKDVKITSPPTALKVLPLPAEGQPRDFSGAVGEFQVSADISPATAAAGEPLTLRLHVTGTGSFDRVNSAMLDHLDQWKVYPATSKFTPSDEGGYKGEKVFEQPMIAEQPGEHAIPAISFSYFNPQTQHYERAYTQPLRVVVGAALADRSPAALAGTPGTGAALGKLLAQGLRADHAQPRVSVRDLMPLYFRASFLAAAAALALALAGIWLGIRPEAAAALARSTARALVQLDEAARSRDSPRFFALAKAALLQTFAARWQMPADQITAAELKARLGPQGADIERLWALADEATYSDHEPGSTDFPHWQQVVRSQLTPGGV